MAAYVALKQIVYPASHETVCFGSCRSYVALGNGKGTVWMLHPVSLSVLSQFTLQGSDGQTEGIQRISVSPDEQLLACITSLGDVTVLQVGGGRVVCRVQEHCEHTITSLAWRTEAADARPTGLYVGDDAGLVTLVNVPKSKVAALFQTPCIRLLQLDSGITQLDYLNDQLVVSTYSATFICDTKQELFTQVGEKLRQGKFGGCLFYVRDSSEHCQSSPGKRDGHARACSTLGCSPSHQLDRSIVEKAQFAEETSGEEEEHFDLINSESRYINSSVSFYLGDTENRIPLKANQMPRCSDSKKHSTCDSFETFKDGVIYHALHASESNTLAVENSSFQYSTPTSSGVGSDVNTSTSPSQRHHSNVSQRGRFLLEEELRVFSGRPQSRVWEADLSGRVIRTHQLARALNMSPLPVYDLREDGKLCADSFTCQELLKLSCNSWKTDTEKDSGDHLNDHHARQNCGISNPVEETRCDNSDVSENGIELDSTKASDKSLPDPLFLVFNQVLRFQNLYLLLVCSRGVYGIDPSTSTVIFFLQVSVLGDVSVSGNSLLLSSVSGEVMRVSVVPPEVALLSLHTLRLFRSCAHLAARHLSLFQHSDVLARVKKVVIRDILGVVDDPSIVEFLEALKKDMPLPLNTNAQVDSIIDKFNNSSIQLDSLRSTVGHHSMSIEERVTPANLAAHSCPATPPARRAGRLSLRQPFSTGYHTPSSGYYSRPLFGFRGYGGSVPPPAEGVEPTSGVLHDFMGSVTSNMTSSLLAAVTTKLAAVASQTRGLHESSKALASNFRGGQWKKGDGDTEGDRTSLEKAIISTVLINVESVQSNVSSSRYISNQVSRIEDAVYDDLLAKSDRIVDSKCVLNDSSNVMNGKVNHLFDHDYDGYTSVGGFEELMVERKPRRKNKKGVGQKDKVMGLSNGQNHLQNVDSFSCKENCEDSSDITTTLENKVSNFARLVTELEPNISILNSDPSKMSILSDWLKEYVKLLGALASNKVDVGDRVISQFMHTSIETSDSRNITRLSFKRGITTLLIYCLEYRNSLELPKLDSSPALPEVFCCNHHPVASEYDKKLDSFFASLLNKSFDLVNYKTIINSLSSLGLDYSPRLWLVLLFQVINESSICPTKGDSILGLCESLDFGRSQKLIFFRHYIEAGQLEILVEAAVKLHHPAVIFDLVLISKHIAILKGLDKANLNQHSKKDQALLSSLKCDSPASCDANALQADGLLYAYLLALSKKYDLGILYERYWCGCRELQYDLVSCILHNLTPMSRQCSCGAPLPKNPCCSLESSLSLVSLLSTIVRGVVYDPSLLAALCHKHCYWSGYYSLMLRYQLSPPHDLLVTGVLQTGCSNTLGLLLEALDHHHASELFGTLASMSEGVTSTNQFRCGKCQVLVTLTSGNSPGIHFDSKNVTGLHLRSDEAQKLPGSDQLKVQNASSHNGQQDCCFSDDPAALLSTMWLRAVQWSLGRIGGRLTLRLLQHHVTDRNPPDTLPPQVYRMCLLCAATEQDTSSYRRILLATACNKPVLPLKEEQHLRALSVESSDLDSVGRSGVSGLNKLSSDAVLRTKVAFIARHEAPTASLPTTALLAEPNSASSYGLVVDTRAGHCGLCQLPISAHSMLTPSIRLYGDGDCFSKDEMCYSSIMGLMVFRCGHAYHTVCLRSHGYKCPKNCPP